MFCPKPIPSMNTVSYTRNKNRNHGTLYFLGADMNSVHVLHL